MMNKINIRVASSDDADAIAALHAASWRKTYRGILSDDYLDNGLELERKRYWGDKLQGLTAKEFVLLAESAGEVVGFICVLDKPEAGVDAFIDNLHARPDRKGQGIGGTLMKAAAQRLRETNRSGAYLWVLEGNIAAEGFYLSKGASVGDKAKVVFGGKEVGQTRFVWHTLDELLK